MLFPVVNLSESGRAWPEWLPAGAMSWSTVIVALAVLVYRLLAEWQRRRTLLALLREAPTGTLIFQGKGVGGAEMCILVGPELGPVEKVRRSLREALVRGLRRG